MVILNGSGVGITTNQLLFPCSYYYYFQFYNDDNGSALQLRRVQEVRFPTRKAISPCFASAPNSAFDIYEGTPTGGHGTKGMSLLFVDGHAQFALYKNLNNTFVNGARKIYNLDWTAGGLSGIDLARYPSQSRQRQPGTRSHPTTHLLERQGGSPSRKKTRKPPRFRLACHPLWSVIHRPCRAARKLSSPTSRRKP